MMIFNLFEPIHFIILALLIVYIVALVYYLPVEVLASLNSEIARLFTLIAIIVLSMQSPDLALLLALAYFTTIQVYRNRLELLHDEKKK